MTPIAQCFLLIGAGFSLFTLWRASLPQEQRWIRLVIVAGFLSRAVLGQILFWISWARLPIASHLQRGEGLWFFAEDADIYFPSATTAAAHGLRAIVMADRNLPSVMYIQALAFFSWLFGSATSVALLLNLFCYLGTIAILVRWSAGHPTARAAAAIGIVAVSISPAFVLWSLQPLKDTFFQFLFVAFIASCAAWQRAWSRTGGGLQLRIGAGIAAVSLLFAISGVRWYFGFAVLIAAAFFLLLVALKSPAWKIVALPAAGVVAFLFSRALIFGAADYLPAVIADALSVRTSVAAVSNLPRSVASVVETVRTGFDGSGGTTTIQTTEVAPVHVPEPFPRGDARHVPPATLQPELASVLPSVPSRSPQVTAPLPALEIARIAPPPTAAPTNSFKSSRRPLPPNAVERHPLAEWITPRASRFFSGLAAIVLPRAFGDWLGAFHIEGGRGLGWFADLDTIAFDIVMLLAIAAIARHLRSSSRNPLMWLVLGVTVLVGAPLVYSVGNFGTLFRLREMITFGLLLTPLAIASPLTGEGSEESGGGAALMPLAVPPEARSPQPAG